MIIRYEHVPPKDRAYYRYILEKILKAGANTEFCFGVGNADGKESCMIEEARHYGDRDLVDLIRKYAK